MTVQTIQRRTRDWYYTPAEWSRHIGWGTVPDERNWLLLPKAVQDAIIKASHFG